MVIQYACKYLRKRIKILNTPNRMDTSSKISMCSIREDREKWPSYAVMLSQYQACYMPNLQYITISQVQNEVHSNWYQKINWYLQSNSQRKQRPDCPQLNPALQSPVQITSAFAKKIMTCFDKFEWPE